MRVCSVCGRCYEDQAVSCIEESHPGLSEIRSGGCEMIAGYHLDFSLESGVKGAIYRAHHITSGRSCLINIVSTNTEYRREFLREAQLAAIFFNPNMADVYEAGTLDNGEVFVVAEDPGGQTLREHLNASVPDLLTSIQIVRQVAEALHAIHLKGLMHRALSPENIVLTTDPENGTLVRLQNLDFGGVAQHSIISNKFLIDTALDSLKYFAPEQCSGDAISIRTDVYSLGVVLYEMLAGTTPFEAAKAAGLIQAHKTERPPEIKIDDFDLRMLLTHTLMESLAKRPDQRQSSANAFARQMRHIEQLATHVSTPPPAVVFPPTPPRSVAAGFGAPARSIFVEPRVIGHEKIKPMAPLIPAIKAESATAAVIEMEIPESSSAEPTADNVVTELGARRCLGLSRQKVRRKKLHRRHRPHPLEEPPPAEDPAVREKVRSTEIRVLPPELESNSVPVQSHLTKIEWDQPDDEIPTVADVLEVLSQDGIAEAAPVHEEITIVTPHSAPIEQLVPVRNRAVPKKAAFAFSPTLLGETAEGDTRASVLLTLSDVLRQISRSLDHRFLMVGAGFVILLGVFLLGNIIVGDHVQPAAPGESVMARIPEQKTQPQTVQIDTAVPTERQPTLAYVEKSQTEDTDLDTSELKPLNIKKSHSAARDKPQKSAGTNERKSSVVSSTVPSDNSKKSGKPQSETNSAASKKAVSVTDKTVGATRPRVVYNPRP